MPAIPLGKNYEKAAEGLMRVVKNGSREDRQEGDANLIEVVGDWEAFDRDELDMWGGRLKFVLKDIEAVSSDELAERGALAMHNPELASLFTGKTLLTVYRQRAGTEEEWEDVTREFATKAAKYGF